MGYCLFECYPRKANNVLSWNKCQGWKGLGFVRQRQGRKKEHLERKEQQRQLADLLVNHQQLQEQAEGSRARNLFPPLCYSPLCSHSAHCNIVSQKEGSTLPRMEVPPHPSPKQASFPATATGLNRAQGTPFLMGSVQMQAQPCVHSSIHSTRVCGLKKQSHMLFIRPGLGFYHLFTHLRSLSM